MGNQKLEELDLSKLKKIQAKGSLKVKITGNGYKMTQNEQNQLLQKTGLKEDQILIENPTTTTKPIVEQTGSSLQESTEAEDIKESGSHAGGTY